MELKNRIWMNGSLEWYAYLGQNEVYLGSQEVPFPFATGTAGPTATATSSRWSTGRSCKRAGWNRPSATGSSVPGKPRSGAGNRAADRALILDMIPVVLYPPLS